ncbi:transglycosylase SLT domain-containing protein [Chromatium okenii]|uniref:Lytic murein transglycosylase n=2 Tax=Chromatium okenii TaxID=61644 RepID=A0A2S7XU90_9GAMM|nr:transglycosylase SLT domain-containing protein [Chromatium okenii]PQJ97307.1 lytic murein transglycosylase [Chromatium okenii]
MRRRDTHSSCRVFFAFLVIPNSGTSAIFNLTFKHLFSAGLLLTATWCAHADDRSDFLAAEEALKRGDRPVFEQLSAKLRAYPLYSYLRFADLERNLDAVSEAEILDFFTFDADSPLAETLRQVYLQRLVTAQRWADYLRIDPPPLPANASTERRCLSLLALLETGHAEEVLPQVAAIWLSPRSQPAACDRVFQAWQQAGKLTPELVWQRIRLAMNASEIGLARWLGMSLPEPERPWLELWLAVDQTPTLISDNAAFATEYPQRAAIVAHGITRLARRAPDDAAQRLTRYRDLLAADPTAGNRAYAAVGNALIGKNNPEGLRYWDGLQANADNLAEQEQRARAALKFQDWGKLATWLAQMPDSTEKRDRWCYWQGRAEAALGQATAARQSFEQAATARSFWGFMAADRLGQPYHLKDVATPAEPARIVRLIRSPAWARLRELRHLAREAEIQREWRTLTQRLEAADLQAAAYIADVLHWHDRAIFTLARSGYWDDLKLRFPLRYQEQVTTQAEQVGIAAEWIFGVMRQESVFAPAVVSRSGAMGLMQLMPKTAAEVAISRGLPAPSSQDLTDPTLNITLGSTYLGWMWKRFTHAALATAAYNAGPGRVTSWLPPQPIDADLWIAQIPFNETRGYVERVLAYRVIYAERLGLPPLRLSDLLPPIPALPRNNAKS